MSFWLLLIVSSTGATLDFSYNGKVLCDYLEKIISKKVISNSEVVRFDKASLIIRSLFEVYYKNPRLLHKGTLRKIYIETRKKCDEVVDFANGDLAVVKDEIKRITETDLSTYRPDIQSEYLLKKKILVRCIVDYIAGMTDSYAINEYNRIFIPEKA